MEDLWLWWGMLNVEKSNSWGAHQQRVVIEVCFDDNVPAEIIVELEGLPPDGGNPTEQTSADYFWTIF